MIRLTTSRGCDAAATAVRSRFSSAERARQLKVELEQRHAQQVVASLGNMKGVLMKLGQMASYIDEGMPAVMRESLATLQQDAPPMDAVLAIDEIERGLGGRLRRFFTDFDETPVAAASIGQVHRAVTRNGDEVAVKGAVPRHRQSHRGGPRQHRDARKHPVDDSFPVSRPPNSSASCG